MSLLNHDKTLLPTSFGTIALHIFEVKCEKWYVSVFGILHRENVYVRIHDACFTSELFSSVKCDCRIQLQHAKKFLSEKGGVLIYTPQEGRGIGPLQKIKAYTHQICDGLNTDDANVIIGETTECRKYDVVQKILKILHIKSIKLLTNNPKKVNDLRNFGIACDMHTFHTTNWPTSKSYLNHKIVCHEHKIGKETGSIAVETALQKIMSLMHNHTSKYPFLILSYAQTLNGSIRSHDEKRLFISSHNSNYIVDTMRSITDYIVVGANTIRLDNPNLKVKFVNSSKNPCKVIFSNEINIPLASNILLDKNNIFFHTNSSDENIETFSEFGQVKHFNGDIYSALKSLGNDEVSVLIEGGANIISQTAKYADLVVLSISKCKVASGGHVVLEKNLEFKELFRFEDDYDLILFGYYNRICEICDD